MSWSSHFYIYNIYIITCIYINVKSLYYTPETNVKLVDDSSKKKTIGRWPKHFFFKEDIQMANKQMRRCSTLLLSREMQIKTTMRYYLIQVRMAIIKKSMKNKYWRGCGKRTLVHCWWECKLVQLLWKMENSTEVILKY